MKKVLINIFLIISFIIIYFIQLNLFSWLKIARSNAKFIYNIYTFYWIIFKQNSWNDIWNWRTE